MNTFIIAIVRNRLDLQVGQDRLLACIGPAILHHLPGYSLGRILGPVYSPGFISTFTLSH